MMWPMWVLAGAGLVTVLAVAWVVRLSPAARRERRQRDHDETVARILTRLHVEAEHLARARGIDYADAVDYLKRGLMDTVRAEAERRVRP